MDWWIGLIGGLDWLVDWSIDWLNRPAINQLFNQLIDQRTNQATKKQTSGHEWTNASIRFIYWSIYLKWQNLPDHPISAANELVAAIVPTSLSNLEHMAVHCVRVSCWFHACQPASCDLLWGYQGPHGHPVLDIGPSRMVEQLLHQKFYIQNCSCPLQHIMAPQFNDISHKDSKRVCNKFNVYNFFQKVHARENCKTTLEAQRPSH